MLKNLKKFKGFTLVETLVAVSILSISILATFTAVQGGLQASSSAKDQITAFYLAQEAMEFIKNIRDENALISLTGTPTNWLNGLSVAVGDPCFFNTICRIDSPNKTIVACGVAFDTCPVLSQDSSTGLYGYTAGWTPTGFKREVLFEDFGANETRVTVRMSWTTRGVAKTFQITQLLFNRQ